MVVLLGRRDHRPGEVDVGRGPGLPRLPRELGAEALLERPDQGVADDRVVVGPEDMAAFDFDQSGGYAGAMRLLAREPRPTALVCSSDLIALGVLDAAADLGLSVPRDVAVTGFDDSYLAAARSVRLTSLAYDYEALTEQALDDTALRVLVVDNDPQALSALRAVLLGWHYQVVEVADGAAAETALAERQADLWLFDYHLDDGDTGVALHARLAARFGARPCLVLSADDSGEVRRITLEHGLGLLPKPVKALALRSMLRRLLAARAV